MPPAPETCSPLFVRRFAEELYGLLAGTEACFLSGTFVIGDDGGGISERVGRPPRRAIGALAGTCRVRPGRFSHYLFQTDRAFQAYKNNAGPSFLRGSTGMQEVAADIIRYGCDPELRKKAEPTPAERKNEVEKKVLLWHAFEVESGGARKRFLFFKLEAAPGLSVSHLAQAASHYLSPAGADRDNDYPIRREDMTYVGGSARRFNGSARVQTKRWVNKTGDGFTEPYDAYTHEEADDAAYDAVCEKLGVDRAAARDEKEWYDRNVRTREEFFVPFVVARQIASRVEAEVARAGGGQRGGRDGRLAMIAAGLLTVAACSLAGACSWMWAIR